MNTEKMYDAYAEDLGALLVGKSIEKIDLRRNTFLLSDGTEVELMDTSDCCAYFYAEIENIDLADNMVVRCEESDNPDSEDGWILTIFGAHKKIADVNVDGDAQNGYYCHSINLEVRRVES